MKTRNPQRLLAYALIAIGVVMLLSRIGGADWLWLTLIGAIFLVGYVSRQNYNFLVAGGVLLGIAVGTIIGTDSGMLLSLAAGFLAIDRVEPKPNRWALYSAGIFAALGALVALGSFGLLGSVGFALVLVAAGAYLLYREGNKPDVPRPPAYSSPDPAAQAPDVQVPYQPGQNQPGQTTGGADQTFATAPATETSAGSASSPASATETPPPTTSAAAPGSAQPGTVSSSGEVPAATAPPPPLSQEAETRLRRLEAWRRETAKTEGVPAYIVFTNDTLAKLAVANPQMLGELSGVKGVGPIKQARYGESVLGVLRGSDEGSSTGVSDAQEGVAN